MGIGNLSLTSKEFKYEQLIQSALHKSSPDSLGTVELGGRSTSL